MEILLSLYQQIASLPEHGWLLFSPPAGTLKYSFHTRNELVRASKDSVIS